MNSWVDCGNSRLTLFSFYIAVTSCYSGGYSIGGYSIIQCDTLSPYCVNRILYSSGGQTDDVIKSYVIGSRFKTYQFVKAPSVAQST